ncbi:hypothetical protein PVK06_012156 [Gossypium arboreum]|uniref:Uncharacterized protein n=1 Tax=Gossypium arboreum TaxID=29729 RepID=A0ABR0QAQ9_GOSAR|nr:hypothetical protein PVK06_012156 [Gossypium arboreum]
MLSADVIRAHISNTASGLMLSIDVIKVFQLKITTSKVASRPTFPADIIRAYRVKLVASTQLMDLRSQLMS